MTTTSTADGTGIPDGWESLGDAARESAVRAVGRRTFARMEADIKALCGAGAPAAEITMGILIAMVEAAAAGAPDGICADCWRSVIAADMMRAAHAGQEPLPANGTLLTSALSIPALGVFTTLLARAGREAMARTSGPGTGSDVQLASALAAHSAQIAGGVMQRARAEGWDADTAVLHTLGLFRVMEAMIRLGLGMAASQGAAGIGEVQGHA